MYIGNRDNKFSLEKHGSILFVHNQTSKPENANGILLKVVLFLTYIVIHQWIIINKCFFQPGSHTNVHIKKKFHTYEPHPFSKSYLKMKEEANSKKANEFNDESLNINVVDRNMLCKFVTETNQIDRIIAEGCRSYLTKSILPKAK